MGLENEIMELVAESAGFEKERFKTSSKLKEDLNMDSLDEAELAMKVEEKYNIVVPEEKAEELRTVNDIIKYVREYKK